MSRDNTWNRIEQNTRGTPKQELKHLRQKEDEYWNCFKISQFLEGGAERLSQSDFDHGGYQ